jgi:hypothetical protein
MNYESNIPTSEEMRAEVDRIINFKTYSVKEKEDKLLFINACLQSQLGTDVSQKTKDHVDLLARIIFRGIKAIDPYVGSRALRTQDGKEY